MALLAPGDPFPTLTFARAGGDPFTLPGVLDGAFGVVLFYRGSWCPYCNAQLRAFQRADALAEVGAKVVAISVDDEPTTAALVAKHRLTFPVGHSADAAAVAAATRAFVDPERGRTGGPERLLLRCDRQARARRRCRVHPLRPPTHRSSVVTASSGAPSARRSRPGR